MQITMRVPPELIMHIGEYLGQNELRLLCLTCKQLNAIAGGILWRVIKATEDKAEVLFKILESSDERAASVRRMTINTSNDLLDEPQHPPQKSSPELCALFARVLRKTTRLRHLGLYCASLAGPAVIAELCAQEHSKLSGLILTIGELDDTEDLSVLQGLRLESGELRTLNVDGCVQAEYPRPYVDAIARIAQASAESLRSLIIDETQHVQQFFKDADRFSQLQNLYIRDKDILALPCVFVDWMTELSIDCQGGSFDPDIASSLIDCFGTIETLRLVLRETPIDIDELISLGEWLIEPIEEIYKITIVASENMETDDANGEDGMNGEHDGGGEEGEDVEIDVDEEDGDDAIGEDGEADEDAVIDEEDDGATSIDGGGGAGSLGQQSEERRLVDEWTRYTKTLNCVEFWYDDGARVWRREYGSKGFEEWKVDARSGSGSWSDFL